MDRTILGIQYYRPPNPEPVNWSEDLKKIKETGLSVIRTWLYWQQVNPAEGKWNFSNYDRLFELAHRNDIKVLVQLLIEVPPEWLIKKYPEARLVRANEQPVIPSSKGSVQVGGFPGLTPDSLPVRKATEEFLHQSVKRYCKHPALFGYDIWNEIMPFYNFKSIQLYFYHPETKKRFQAWLRKRYKTIERLNSFYCRNYESFNELAMPSEGVFLEMLDLHEFVAHWIADYMSWKASVVRGFDSKHPVVSHTGGKLEGLLTAPFDSCQVAKPLDIWGSSCYETDFWRVAFQCVLTRDSAQGKPWGIVEMSGGRTWWGPYGNILRTPEFLEQLPLLALSYGGKFNLFWQWRPERFGQESPNFGLVNEDGSFNVRTHRIARLAKSIQKNQMLFDRLEFPVNDVGLLIDWRSFSLEHTGSGEAGRFTLPEYLGWFQALSELGANVEVLYGSKIAQEDIPKNIKLLIAPLLNIERPGIMAALGKFITRGGHFLAGPYLFTYDSFTYMHPQTPPVPMQRIFGSRRVELLYPKEPYLETISDYPSKKMSGYHCLEVYDCQKAMPWLSSRELISGTRHISGKSICYRVGSLLGSAYTQDNGTKPNDFLYLLENILSSANCSYQPPITGKVLIRMGKSRQHRLLFVHNSSESQQTVWVRMKEDVKEARDLITGEKLELFNKKNILISLQQRESKIIYC